MTDERPPFRVVGAGAVSANEKKVDEWAERTDDDLLGAMRGLAQSWTTTLSTLLGLLGAGSVLGADAAVRALDGRWSVAFGLLAAGALAAAGVALFAAHTASQQTEVRIGPTLGEREQAYGELVARARRWLRASHVATALAVALLAASFAVRWFAPLSSP